MEMSNKKVLVYDLGLFPEMALRLLRDCASVEYYVPWPDAFPEAIKALIGENFDGVSRIDTFWDKIDSVDLIVVPDTMCGDIVEYLKKHKYPVCGAGSIEKFELDRWHGRKLQDEIGLPVQETYKITGVRELAKFLKEHKNFYIKIDKFRGVLESFKHTDWTSSEQEVDNIALKMGPFKEDIVFIVEEILEGVEPGIDGITFDGDLLFPTMGGYEAKGCGIIERVYADAKELPVALKAIDDAVSPEFKKNSTRFFYSIEMKIDKDKIPYVIDPTMRLAAPGTSAIQFEAITNISEVIYGLATGEKVNPVIKGKYWAAVAGDSSKADKRWLNVSVPANIRQWVKFRMAAKHDNKYYACPGFPSICTVLGSGDTIDEAIAQVRERSEQVKAAGLVFDCDGLDNLKKDINAGHKYGVNF